MRRAAPPRTSVHGPGRATRLLRDGHLTGKPGGQRRAGGGRESALTDGWESRILGRAVETSQRPGDVASMTWPKTRVSKVGLPEPPASLPFHPVLEAPGRS